MIFFTAPHPAAVLAQVGVVPPEPGEQSAELPTASLVSSHPLFEPLSIVCTSATSLDPALPVNENVPVPDFMPFSV